MYALALTLTLTLALAPNLALALNLALTLNLALALPLPPNLALPQNAAVIFFRWRPEKWYFDHEKLTVYQKSIEFVAFVAALLPRLQSPFGNTRDQLLRSSQSIALNIAEGNGKRSPADRRRYFEIARGSAMESAATLNVLVALGAFSLDEIAPGKTLLFPVVKMLSKMTECPEAAREEMAEYGSQDTLGD